MVNRLTPEIGFFQDAATLLETLCEKSPSLSDLVAQSFRKIAMRLKDFPRTFVPEAQNSTNRAKCIDTLIQDRGLFALLSADPELTPLGRGIGIGVAHDPTAPTSAFAESFGVSDSAEWAQFRSSCARTTIGFTRLIEALNSIPVVTRDET